jgi:hypothetical protein
MRHAVFGAIAFAAGLGLVFPTANSANAQVEEVVAVVGSVADLGESVKRLVGLFQGGEDPAARTQEQLRQIEAQNRAIAAQLTQMSQDLKDMEVRIIEAGKNNFDQFIQTTAIAHLRSYYEHLDALQHTQQPFFGINLSGARRQVIASLSRQAYFALAVGLDKSRWHAHAEVIAALLLNQVGNLSWHGLHTSIVPIRASGSGGMWERLWEG